MGELYKGRDTRLNRIVALKVLPAHLAERADLRERFEREATTVANLKHPNICVLYDIGEDNGAHFLVLEFLEGETLAQRLMKGTLPLEQVLKYAIEVSDALDKAHRSGVTHRDIKPGNIMLTKEGSKVLDFGLAKLKQEATQPNLPQSLIPTAPSGLTQDGQILGTLQYMSPEQVEGKIDDIDPRTDIFAFGAVVYEMVTGKKAFEGKSSASVIAKILETDPPVASTLQPMSPPALNHVVQRCLAKEREQRWQAASDVWHERTWISSGGGAQAGMPAPLAARRKRRERFAWALAALAVAAAAAALSVLYLFCGGAQQEPVRFTIPEPPGAIFNLAGGPTTSYVALSPDGGRVAFVARSAGGNRIWVRSLDSLEAQPLPGTEGANSNPPFWSPDSRFLGFFAQEKLKKVDVSGGPPQTLCDAPTATGGTWNRDGTILFDSGASSQGTGLYRVSAAGGKPAPITSPNQSLQELVHAWPHFLPDGRHFLYLARNSDPEKNAIYVAELDSEETTPLLNANSRVLYSPSGYLLFVREGSLMAQPFDADELQTVGDAFPIAERVRHNTGNGSATFSVSDNAVLAYRTTDAGAANTQLAWFDCAGKELGRIAEPGPYVNPEISPDGKRLAVERAEAQAGSGDIWVFDLSRGTSSRFTFDPAGDTTPIWSPDGSTILFASIRNGIAGLYQKNSSGLGNEDLLVKVEGQSASGSTMTEDWSSDGRWVVYSALAGSRDVWVVPLSGDSGPPAPAGRGAGAEARKPLPVLNTQFGERQAQVSPDGRWIAYVSNESGRNEVYVQSFPKPGGKWQISTSGGIAPRWRPDGQRFLLNVEQEAPSSSPITVVLNWTAAFKK